MDFNPEDPSILDVLDVIDYLEFGILSAREIQQQSVCEITNSNLDGPESIYDTRMGIVGNGKKCDTCFGTNIECPGHFGHIRLQTYIVMPLLFKETHDMLRCVCHKCGHLKLSKTELGLHGLLKTTTSFRRFNKIARFLKDNKRTRCSNKECMEIHREYLMTPEPNQIWYFFKDKSKKRKITAVEILDIFRKIPEDDLTAMLFNPENHPERWITNMITVMPPCDRPFIISNGKKCDDDLTGKYTNIVTANNKLAAVKISESRTKEADYEEARITLEGHISTLQDNTKNKARQSNRRQTKCVTQRLQKKDGLIRGNMQGKRVDFSARTVITPDPSLALDELGVPESIAKTQTYPDMVSMYNIDFLTKLLEEDKIAFVIRDGKKQRASWLTKPRVFRLHDNDIVVRGEKRFVPSEYYSENKAILVVEQGDAILREVGRQEVDGNIVVQRKKIIPNMKKRHYQLQYGDIVERYLMTGDVVLFNRQPTLHKQSMMAHYVVVLPYDTFRLNLSVTSPYNADFDGDEMNMHVPQSFGSRIELEEIVLVTKNIVSAQANKPIMGIVQDALVASYILTQKGKTISQSWFDDCTMAAKISIERAQSVLNRALQFEEYCDMKFDDKDTRIPGKLVFSTLFPEDFFYTCYTDVDEREPIVVIENGIIRQGRICKQTIGTKQNSIIHVMFKEYGHKRCGLFISELQWLVNLFIGRHGFSVDIGDCMIDDDIRIKKAIATAKIEADAICKNETDLRLRELKINAALNKAKDIGEELSRDAISEHNRLRIMIECGSKGNYINMAQIIALLGQQNVGGGRIPQTLCGNTRTLPMFEQNDRRPEARGLVESSFLDGLKPWEYWFHAAGGREGLADTAVKTADSGYMERKLVKSLEDCKVYSDGTVRNAKGTIMQFSYGGDSLDGSQVMVVKKKRTFVDAIRLATRMNHKAAEMRKKKMEAIVPKKSNRKLPEFLTHEEEESVEE